MSRLRLYKFGILSALVFLIFALLLEGRLQAATPYPVRSLSENEFGGGVGNNDNPHNLSAQSTNAIRADSETRICVFCHTPHGATAQSTLWNRPDPDTIGTPGAWNYPLFNTALVRDTGGELGIDDGAIVTTTKYENTNANIEYPNGATKLCLSCHDGATAIGTLSDGTAIAMWNNQDTITDSTKFWNPVSGGGMKFDATHPVSFVYTSAVKDHLNTDTLVVPPFTPGGDKDQHYVWTSATEDLLDAQSRVQCTSCHNPHLDTRDTAAGYDLPFWRNYSGTESTDYDNTCLTCHETNPGGGAFSGNPPMHDITP